ncbi:PA14 domain-containing protein [Rhodococcoides yunnanense]|uniref:PA14 domain-containing protein n=1 Tax=Rhodococcoides yunnanense TaxID=278209 RepID=UPI001FE264B7|nr:PA14 domain-containing protein [Rhodococcus yunnanensis]
MNLYLATYYNNLSATGTPVTSRCEYSVGSTWEGRSPAPGVNAGNFSVLYTGSINFPVSGTYNVNAQTGFVGIQAKIDGNTVIDYWPNQTWGRYHATANVTAGVHSVSVAVSNPTKNGHEHFSITQTGTSPSANNGNYFAANSFWNQPIPSNAIVHPNSDAWRNLVANDSRNNAINVNSSQWSTGIYKAPAGTPTVSVQVTNSNKTITVPYLPSYRPTPDADAHLSIIDESNGCLYEFQAFDAGRKTAVAQATYPAYTGSGAHASGPAHSGGDLSYVAGTITPQDVKAGVIDHALRFAIPNNSADFLYPATRSDGTTVGGVPEGIRIQLDPSLDLDAAGLNPFQKMVAKALQTYGGFDADGSANFAIYAQSPDDGSTYPMALDALPKSLIGKLRYLAPTFTSTDVQMATAFDTGCQQAR